jgi:hypothetical protein
MKQDITQIIFNILLDSDKPLNRKEICIVGNIQPQLFDYWIKYMLENSIVISTSRKRYTVQKIFKDTSLIPYFNELITKITNNTLFNNNEISYEEVITLNISLYLSYLSNK